MTQKEFLLVLETIRTALNKHEKSRRTPSVNACGLCRMGNRRTHSHKLVPACVAYREIEDALCMETALDRV